MLSSDNILWTHNARNIYLRYFEIQAHLLLSFNDQISIGQRIHNNSRYINFHILFAIYLPDPVKLGLPVRLRAGVVVPTILLTFAPKRFGIFKDSVPVRLRAVSVWSFSFSPAILTRTVKISPTVCARWSLKKPLFPWSHSA